MPSDWCQVEVISLINDGTGLGFGIIGGQQTGVVVKTILPGGVADRYKLMTTRQNGLIDAGHSTEGDGRTCRRTKYLHKSFSVIMHRGNLTFLICKGWASAAGWLYPADQRALAPWSCKWSGERKNYQRKNDTYWSKVKYKMFLWCVFVMSFSSVFGW